MSLTKKVLDWTERKQHGIRPNDKFGGAKAFGLGCIEGVIDGSVIMYPVLIASIVVASIANKSKK